MPEVPHPREHHGQAGRVGGRDHLIVAQRASRLDHGGRAAAANFECIVLGAGSSRKKGPGRKVSAHAEAVRLLGMNLP
jgi:hypothetical protein